MVLVAQNIRNCTSYLQMQFRTLHTKHRTVKTPRKSQHKTQFIRAARVKQISTAKSAHLCTITEFPNVTCKVKQWQEALVSLTFCKIRIKIGQMDLSSKSVKLVTEMTYLHDFYFPIIYLLIRGSYRSILQRRFLKSCKHYLNLVFLQVRTRFMRGGRIPKGPTVERPWVWRQTQVQILLCHLQLPVWYSTIPVM